MPAVRRGDEEERQNQRGQDPMAVHRHGLRRQPQPVSMHQQADDVRAFLNWLLSADTQEGRGVSARTLRRRNELGWSLWPPCPMGGQVHDVVHLDGIHLGRKAVVLIAYAGGHVIGWYVARRETSAAWMSLMARIAEPVVVVCDGGGGIRKALRHAWPHVFVFT